VTNYLTAVYGAFVELCLCILNRRKSVKVSWLSLGEMTTDTDGTFRIQKQKLTLEVAPDGGLKLTEENVGEYVHKL